MPIRFTGLYKSHQPNDLASFDAVETQHIVSAGLGHIEDAATPHEEALAVIHRTLATGPVVGDDGVALRPSILRPSIALPTTRAADAIPPAMTPAAGAEHVVVDALPHTPALERASSWPAALPGRDPHAVGLSSLTEVIRRGDPYAQAHGMLTLDEAQRLGMTEADTARVAALRSGDGAATIAAMDRDALEQTALLMFRERLSREDDGAVRRLVEALVAERVAAEAPTATEGQGEGDDGRGEEDHHDGGSHDGDPPLSLADAQARATEARTALTEAETVLSARRRDVKTAGKPGAPPEVLETAQQAQAEAERLVESRRQSMEDADDAVAAAQLHEKPGEGDEGHGGGGGGEGADGGGDAA